jgi:hypothetical protein
MPAGMNTEYDESSLSPTVASFRRNENTANSPPGSPGKDVQAARRGLLKAIWQTTLAPRFSSRPIDLKTIDATNPSASAFSSAPIDMDGYFSSSNPALAGSFVRQNSAVTVGTLGTNSDGITIGSKQRTESFRNSLGESSYLTPSEQGYLQELLQSDDLDSIRRASVRLADKEVFPTATDSDDELDLTEAEGNGRSSEEAVVVPKRKSMPLPPPLPPKSGQQKRRDSQVQEQLLEWHEKTTIMPSVVLHRVSSNQSAKKLPPMPTGSRTIPQNNSMTHDDNYDSSSILPSGTNDTMGEIENGLKKMNSEEGIQEQDDLQSDSDQVVDADQNKNEHSLTEDEQAWNSDLSDLNSWIARTEGVEVDEEGHTSTSAHMTSNPFKILGTSANDVSCQPMVLSPPLMEGLQNFMPESLHEHHYWLKYSLVRDGPGLMKMLRHCRGSQHTILAIESTDGHVFGSFTSQPWRLTSPNKGTNHFYGSKESFVWRMRQSRFEPCQSVVEQLMMESKMDVFPFTSQNNYVQSCATSGIALGYGEIEVEGKRNSDGCDTDDADDSGDVHDELGTTTRLIGSSTSHYGHAIKLDKLMATGSTSSSETFGNPCLIERESRGKKFEVANVELWTMTPHDSVEDADQAEMRALFLEENRNTDNNLNLIEILVGTHKS